MDAFSRATRDTRATLFDMDGLLVDSEPLWFEVELDFARELGCSWDAARASVCVGRGLPFTADQLLQHAGSARSTDDGVSWLVDRFISRAGEVRPKRGALEALDAACAAGKTAIASSSPERLVLAVLEGLGLRGRFGAISTGDRVARVKPFPDVFLRAAELLGVDPTLTIVLEDSVAGAEAGRAAGAFVIGVPDFHTDAARLAGAAHRVEPSLVEVAALLEAARAGG